tara:strand:+ start:1258 stop:1743 length:486 start_codon:yes stop_codon:yes gene_type:complete
MQYNNTKKRAFSSSSCSDSIDKSNTEYISSSSCSDSIDNSNTEYISSSDSYHSEESLSYSNDSPLTDINTVFENETPISRYSLLNKKSKLFDINHIHTPLQNNYAYCPYTFTYPEFNTNKDAYTSVNIKKEIDNTNQFSIITEVRNNFKIEMDKRYKSEKK